MTAKNRVTFMEADHITPAGSPVPWPVKQHRIDEAGDMTIEMKEIADGVDQRYEIFVSSQDLVRASPVFRNFLESDHPCNPFCRQKIKSAFKVEFARLNIQPVNPSSCHDLSADLGPSLTI
jgi:hypothetical protein